MTIKFTCPSCGSNRLEQCYDGPHKCEITSIDAEGDFDYGEYNSSTEPDRSQCLTCGFVITDDDSGARLWDNEEVVAWIKKHCPQEDN